MQTVLLEAGVDTTPVRLLVMKGFPTAVSPLIYTAMRLVEQISARAASVISILSIL